MLGDTSSCRPTPNIENKVLGEHFVRISYRHGNRRMRHSRFADFVASIMLKPADANE